MTMVSLARFQQCALPFWEVLSARGRHQVLKDMPDPQSFDSREVLLTVVELWSADVNSGDLSEQTFHRYRGLVEQYINFTHAQGFTTLDSALELFEQWLCAAGRDRSGRLGTPAIAIRHLRSCAVRALYATAKTFGATSVMPRYEGRDGSDMRRQGRALNECEVDRCRSVAFSYLETRLASAVALALCGAGTADIGNVKLKHIDLSDGSLLLPGSRHIKQRRVAIAGDWEYDVIAHRHAALTCTGGSSDIGFVIQRNGSEASRQAGAAMALAQILNISGYSNDLGLKPASFQRWAGVTVFDQSSSIIDVAKLLGSASLDAAARAIDLDWRGVINPAKIKNPLYQPRVLS
jgi:hypothetical protein